MGWVVEIAPGNNTALGNKHSMYTYIFFPFCISIIFFSFFLLFSVRYLFFLPILLYYLLFVVTSKYFMWLAWLIKLIIIVSIKYNLLYETRSIRKFAYILNGALAREWIEKVTSIEIIVSWIQYRYIILLYRNVMIN